MTEEKKTVTMKSGNKKHDFTLIKTSIGGHTFISLKKNDGITRESSRAVKDHAETYLMQSLV